MSIRENGIVQPVLVRPKGSRFELVAGERRWRAAQLAGLERIPAVIREIANDKVLELALIENIQREDLNAIEEARAYTKLIDTVGLTQESLAQRVGRDRSYITNHIRLLRLPDDLLALVQEGKLSAGHARTLLGTDDVATQRRVAKKIIAKGLSVRDTEKIIQQLLSSPGKPDAKRGGRSADPNLQAAEAKLRRKLGTRINILPSVSRPGGKIEIEYYDDRDLDRFYALLMAGTGD
jgi:ParB family chromosome partitioning protein